MSDWNSAILTKKGLNLQAKVEAGETLLNVTKIQLGSGILDANEDSSNLIALKKSEKDIEISDKIPQDGGLCTISGVISNQDINIGFYVKEMGLFATDPDEGEILYMYTTDNKPDYLPAKSTNKVVNASYNIDVAISNSELITAKINQVGLVTVEIMQHNITEHDSSEVAHTNLFKNLFNTTTVTAEAIKNKIKEYARDVDFIIQNFNNIEEMKQSNNLKSGGLIKTQGFYIAGDGGGADYIIVNDIGEDEVDEASIIALQKGLYAKLLIQTYINAKWFGAKGDGITDDTTNINKITTFLLKNITKYGVYGNTYSVIFPKGIYKINSTINILYSCTNWYFEGAIINAAEITGDAVLIVNTSGMSGELNYSINGLRVIGNIDNTNGIQFGEDNDNDMHAIIFKNVSVRECKTALNFDKKNNYIITFYDTALSNCETCLNFSSGSNSGEKITFINSALVNSDIAVISDNSSSDLYFINCSFDYNKVCYIARSGSVNYLIDCHIEWTNKEQEHFQVYGTSSLNIRGGYLICQGEDDYAMPICKIDRDSGVGLTIDGTFVHNLKAPALANSGAIVRTSNINGFKFGVFPFKTPDFYTFSATDTSLPLFIKINNDYTIKDGYVSITKTNNLAVSFISKVKNKNNFKQTYSIKAISELPSSCHVWSSSSFVVKLQDGSYKQLYLQGTGDIRDNINSNVGNYFKDTSYLWRELKVEEENWGEIYAMQNIWFYGVPDDTTEICLKDLKIEGW